MYCTRCGSANDDRAPRCLRCGAPFAAGRAAPPATPAPHSAYPVAPPPPPPPPYGQYPAPPLMYQGPGVYRAQDDAGMRMLLPVGRSGWAIAAGYAGLLSFVILPGPLALILSIIAMYHLKSRPDLHGMGRAVFGLIMGILGTAVLIMMIVGGAFAHAR